MILADKITEERKRNGWSQEELAEKLGVSRQAVSKWESAGSVPDLQRVIGLSELFGVSTDYLLRDELEREETGAVSVVSTDSAMGNGGAVRRVSMEEANVFLAMKRKGASGIANATSMCIVSPALLVLLGTLAESHKGNLSEALAGVLGVVFLSGMIAAAVFLFITYNIKSSHVEHLEKECFETEYGVSGMVKEKRNEYEKVFAGGIAGGVILCVVAALPLLIAGIMEAPDYVCGAFTALLLVVIAAGVNMLIRVGMIKGSYDTLLQEGEYSKEEKKLRKRQDSFSGAYWCLMTGIYIGWSFYTMRWDITWIVWPVAGLLYGAIYGILRLIATLR